MTNPFAPGAGTPPPALVGRRGIMDGARVALARIKAGRPEKGFLMVGLRGVGKTVLLVAIHDIARELGYEVVKIEAPEKKSLPALLAAPLREILLRLDRMEGLNQLVKRALRVFKGFSVKADLEGSLSLDMNIEPEPGAADSGDLEHDLSSLFVAMGEAAKARGTAIALIIDEMQYIAEKEMGALIAAMHQVNQRQLPVVLIGAGLPQLLGQAGNAKSYAERLFNYPRIGELGAEDARAALLEPVRALGADFDAEGVEEAIRLARGYPYFLQEWGYEAWNAAESSPISLATIQRITPQVVHKLDEGFFRVRFDRLTPNERDYLRAMAQLGPGPHRSSDISAALGVRVEKKAAVRATLIEKGMIYPPAHGDTAFTVPLFDEFMRRTMPDWQPKARAA